MSRRLKIIHQRRAAAMAKEGSKFAARRDPADPLGPVDRHADAPAARPTAGKKKAKKKSKKKAS